MRVVLILVALACCLTIFIVVSDSDDNVVVETTQRSSERTETIPELPPIDEHIPIPCNGEGEFSVQKEKEVTKKPQPIEIEFGWDVIDQYFVSKIQEGMERSVLNGAEFVKKLQNGEKPEIPDWAILSFGEGVFDLTRTLKENSFGNLSSDILFEGAGMNKTLLIFGRGIDISFEDKIKGLAFRDLTLDVHNDCLFDVTSKSDVTLDLTRVRIVRFDSGTGGSCLFYIQANPCTVRAKDSEFICGYGRGNMPGTLYGKGDFLAYFFNCKFELMDFDLGKKEGYKIRFDKCKFVNIREDETFTDKPDPSGTRNPSVVFNFCELDGLLEKCETISAYRKDFEKFLLRFPKSDQ